MAQEGLNGLYTLIEDGASTLSFEDRALMSQQFEAVRLAYAEMLGRGANFTETEQKMIEGVIGGDPNDIIMRALRGDKSYLKRLKIAAKGMERATSDMMGAFTTLPKPAQWVWDEKAGGEQPQTQEAVQPVSGPLSPSAVSAAETPSQENLEHTAKIHGISVEEVLERLRSR